MNQTFLALIKNDLSFEKNRHGNWVFIFRILAWLSFAASIIIFPSFFQPQFLVSFPVVILLMFCLGRGIRSIKQEWNGGTTAWWLSLPYPRNYLLLAKFTANLIRFIRLFVVFIVITIVLIFIGSLTNPIQWSNEVTNSLKMQLVLEYSITLFLSPFAIVTGMATAVLQKSRLKALSAVLWIAVIFSISAIVSHSIVGKSFFPVFNLETFAIFNVVLPLFAAIVLFFFSSYVLDRLTEV